jgi:hypothetical protein
MKRFGLGILAIAGCFAASAGAAEYRFDVYGVESLGLPSEWADIPSITSLSFPPDTAGPAGVQVSYPSVPGTDSMTWRVPRTGIAGRSCLSCAGVPEWIRTAFTSGHLALESRMQTDSMALANARTDTQQVLVAGASRTYIRTRTGYCCTLTLDGTALVGVGTVYFQERYNPTARSYYLMRLRMLEYNGTDIESLWNSGVLPPVAIRPSTRRSQPRLASRKFDLHEMGIFLGRKSALKEPLPETR